MDVSSLTSTGAGSAFTVAAAGFAAAQARVTENAVALASGDLDPAVIVDLRLGEVAAAATAMIMRKQQDGFTRLLDVLA